MTPLCSLNAREIVSGIRKGLFSPEELFRSLRERTASRDGEIGAFLSRSEELAPLAEGPLKGVPVAIKDNILVHGMPLTCASKILENYVAPYDATVVARLKQTGGWVPGKTNMDEFAMGSSTENSALGVTRNPWNLSRVPGGSSGGSAAAVASFQAPLALGSDTGGSVRQPATFCGLYGLKPTYGRISRYGLVAFASSLDQIGLIGRNPEDISLLFENIAGHDPQDSTSLREPLWHERDEVPKGLPPLAYLALPDEGVDPEIREAYPSFLKVFQEMGYPLEEVRVSHWEYALYVYYVIASSEASSNLARFDGIRYGFRSHAPSGDALYDETRTQGFGPEVRRRILLGTFSLGAGQYDKYYGKAFQVRNLIAAELRDLFSKYPFLLLPSTPDTAFALGSKSHDPVKMYYSDYFTIPLSLAGYPALSLPFCLSGEGLPIGFQIAAPYLCDERMLRLASRYEGIVGGEETLKKRFILGDEAFTAPPESVHNKDNQSEEVFP